MTFEEYLQDEHLSFYTGIKDDHQEAFDNWLADLDVDEWLEYGDKYKAVIVVYDTNRKE